MRYSSDNLLSCGVFEWHGMIVHTKYQIYIAHPVHYGQHLANTFFASIYKINWPKEGGVTSVIHHTRDSCHTLFGLK